MVWRSSGIDLQFNGRRHNLFSGAFLFKDAVDGSLSGDEVSALYCASEIN